MNAYPGYEVYPKYNTFSHNSLQKWIHLLITQLSLKNTIEHLSTIRVKLRSTHVYSIMTKLRLTSDIDSLYEVNYKQKLTWVIVSL